MASSGSSNPGWFSRVFGSKSSSSTPATPTSSGTTNPPQSPSASSAKSADEQKGWLDGALKKMLRVKTLPAVTEKLPDPEARNRILAACELDQIPALQALVQGFTRATSRRDVTVDEVV